MTLPHGAYAPIPTPLDGHRLPDSGSLERHLEFLGHGGLDGVLVLGTNGEFPSFDISERLAIAEAAARFAPDLSLMLGVGSCALPEVIQMIQAASHFRFDSILLPPPYFFRSAPAAGLTAFFLEALDAAELPVLLYHIPQVTGVAVSDEVLDAVSGHPRFGGVKDSSGNAAELDRLTSRLGDRCYMVGNDHLLTTSREAGGAGSITAAASIVPELVAAVHDDPSRQPALDAVRDLLESFGLGPAVKAVLRSRGIGAYSTRPPLLDLDDDQTADLLSRLEPLIG
jgi:4-hydroxy-tetrahydrodipicolinate synthase